MDEPRLNYLIEKYIDGTASTPEREELLTWYRQKGSEDSLWPYDSKSEEQKAKDDIFKRVKKQVNPSRGNSGRISTLLIKIGIAASVAGFFACFAIWHFQQKAPQPVLATIVTKAGERKKVELADGSVIWLSAKSTLTYPTWFNGSNREVKFTGEAFFDIFKDKKHPFIVHTGNTSTRVLGTSFNITALSNHDEITVALVTGKVLFTSSKTNVSLLPNNQVVFDKRTNKAKLSPIADIEAVTNRHNGFYEYKNAATKVVAEDLSRLYNMNIRVEGKVANCTFFGRIKPGENPIQFLKKMAYVVNASVSKKDSVWIIKGGGCNLN